jgi:LuxR family transcriptional regulator, maltose regulon positive regulatory protein
MQCPKEEVATLHQQAALWLAANILTEDAVAHFLAAGDEEGAARTVEALILDLVNSEHFTTLHQLISLLPRSLVERRPALLLATAWIHNMRFERDAFPAILVRVEAILNEERWQKVDTTALWGQVHALRTAIYLRSGDVEAVISNAELAFNLLPEAFVWVRAFVLNILAHLYIVIGKPEQAHQMLGVERSKVTPTPSIYLLRLSFSDGVVYHHCDTVAERRRAGNYHLSLASQLNNPIQSAWAEYALGIVHLECGEIDEAVKRLESVLAHHQFAFTMTLFLAASELLPIYASRSQFVEGSSLLTVLGQHMRGSATQSSQLELDAIQSYWAGLAGDRANAQQWAESAELVLPPAEASSPYNLTLARVLYMLGGASNLERAAAMTNALISYYRKLNLIIRLIETLVLHARICWAQRMHTPALTAMREALDLGYPRGYRTTFMDQSRITREILYELTQDRRYTTIAGDLLAEMMVKSNQQSVSTTQQSDASGAKIESLSEREFEILTLLAEGLTNKEIAHRLRISPLTVRNHTAKIYAKFHVATRRQAVIRGRQFGILTADTFL